MRFFGRVVVLVTLTLIGRVCPVGAQGDFPREVIDTSGQTVLIPARPQIVAVSGHVPVLALLVPDVRQVGAVPDLGADVGLLVVPEESANPAVIEAAASIPIFRAAPVTTLNEWRLLAERLGAALGREAAATRLIERLNRVLAWLDGRALGEVRVLVITPEGYTFGQGTLITELITAAGGINAAAEAGYDDYRQITDTVIRDLAPDVILLSPAWGTPEIAAFRSNLDVPARVIRLTFSPTMPDDPAAALLVLGMALHPLLG